MASEPRGALLREFVRRPTEIGAVAPSSGALARAMVQGLDWDHARVVVECGPGMGAFTSHILARIAPEARFFAVEINETCAQALERAHPDVDVRRACVSQLGDLCRNAGVDEVDVILSGLPWAGFSPPDQERLLSSLHAALRPGGQMVTFAYRHAAVLPAGRRFRRLLERTFSDVVRSETVWLNLPPAFVYRCRK